MVSPTLDPIVNPNLPVEDREDSKAESSKKAKKSAKALRRAKGRKAKREKARLRASTGTQEHPDSDGSDDDESTTNHATTP